MAMSPFRACGEKPEVTHKELRYIESDYLSVARPYIRTYTFTHTHWTCSFCSRTDSHLTPAAKTHDREQHLAKKGEFSCVRTRAPAVITYISCCERNHGEKDDAQFSFWHLCAHRGQDSHDSTRLWI